MVWSIFDLIGVFGSLALHAGMESEKGLWTAVIVLLLAVVTVGGSLMAFLIRSAQSKTPRGGQFGTSPDGAQGQDRSWRSER